MTTNELVQQARQQSLGDLPRRTARRAPAKEAIVDGDVRLSFAELDAVVDRTAAALADAGLAPGDRLALLSHNCWQFAVLNFATARAGVVLVPINFMLGGDEIAFILDHSGASAFVVEDALVPVAERAIASSGGGVTTRAVLRRTGEALPDGWLDAQEWFDHAGAAPAAPVAVADDDPVRLMFTSGTESRPKGAILTSRALLWQYVSCAIDGSMSADDVDLHTLPLYHCAQLDCFLGVDVYLGATSIILPAPDPAAILRTIEAERVTKFFAPPTVWISLLRAPGFDEADLSSLRKGYYGASAMPVEVLKEIQAPAARRRPVELLRADRDGAARHDPRAGRAAHAPRLGGPRGAERRDPDRGRRRRAGARRAPSVRSCTARRTRRWATSTTTRRPRRRSAAAGSTPATWGTSTTPATCTSWTARRT